MLDLDRSVRATRREKVAEGAFILDHMATPIGKMLLVADGEGQLRALDWEDYEDRMRVFLRRHYGEIATRLKPGRIAAGIREAIAAYLKGDLAALDRVPVATNGTDFQRCVWTELRRIPAGTTVSYGVLAARIGRPSAVRAVGHANGDNPISVVVPCHRVIGADGSLTGYGGGLQRKRWLLAHEGVEIEA
jgi:methylated-DNA-[protein]-cysteine S-methyltransferase